MHVPYGEGEAHAEKLKRGLVKLGPNFIAQICWWCDGTTMHKFEPCDICGKGRIGWCGLGLLQDKVPAPESVVNQVLVAAEHES